VTTGGGDAPLCLTDGSGCDGTGVVDFDGGVIDGAAGGGEIGDTNEGIGGTCAGMAKAEPGG
jgi:hypothetical protein